MGTASGMSSNQGDGNLYSQTIKNLEVQKRSAKIIPTFLISSGKVLHISGFSLERPGPIFRSNGSSVIHSELYPLSDGYVLLELSTDENDTVLFLEKGGKKDIGYGISLYIDDEPTDKRRLCDTLRWDIGKFQPGRYKLALEEETILQFTVCR